MRFRSKRQHDYAKSSEPALYNIVKAEGKDEHKRAQAERRQSNSVP